MPAARAEARRRRRQGAAVRTLLIRARPDQTRIRLGSFPPLRMRKLQSRERGGPYLLNRLHTRTARVRVRARRPPSPCGLALRGEIGGPRRAACSGHGVSPLGVGASMCARRRRRRRVPVSGWLRASAPVVCVCCDCCRTRCSGRDGVGVHAGCSRMRSGVSVRRTAFQTRGREPRRTDSDCVRAVCAAACETRVYATSAFRGERGTGQRARCMRE